MTLARAAFGLDLQNIDLEFLTDLAKRELTRAKIFNDECCALGEALVARDDLIGEVCDIFGVKSWREGGIVGAEARQKKADEFVLDEWSMYSLKSLKEQVLLTSLANGFSLTEEHINGLSREELIVTGRTLTSRARAAESAPRNYISDEELFEEDFELPSSDDNSDYELY